MTLKEIVKDSIETLQNRCIYFTVDDIVEDIAYSYAGYEDWQDIIANYDDPVAIRQYKNIKAAVVHELPEWFEEAK